MSELSPVLRQRFFDADGAPLVGGLLYTYQAGTTTPLATYTDESGVTPNTNPVVLDANGEAEVWIGIGNYKFILNDSSDVTQWTVDNVRSLAAQIAEQINITGALAVVNNLSDLSDTAAARKNLGISSASYPVAYSATSGQSATALSGQTFDGSVYSSVDIEAEIQQGTTIFSKYAFSLLYLSTAWQLVNRSTIDVGVSHGLTFSITQATTIATLRVAESGLGNATIKLTVRKIPVTP